MSPQLPQVRVRYLLLLFVLTMIPAIVGAGVYGPGVSAPAERVMGEVGFGWAWYVSLLVTTVLYARRAGISFAGAFGAPLPGAQVARMALLGVPLVACAVLAIYAVFGPLSLVWPDAVQWWLFEFEPHVYTAEAPYPILANLLGLSMLVILGPVIEEWFFRGLLLRRMTTKWGSVAGVLLSSLIFGLLHVDIVGGMVFGIIMCALYARYGTLWAPTIAHAANNAITCAVLVLSAHGVIAYDTPSVEMLQKGWLTPSIALVVIALWVPRAWAAWRPIREWQFGTPSDAV